MRRFYNWKQDAIRDGRGFLVTVGTFSDPVIGGGEGDVVVIDLPEAMISVPDGTSIMPIRIDVQCQVPIIATSGNETEIIIGCDKDAAWDTDGTSQEETPINMKTKHTASSLCSAESAFTAAPSEPPALDYELARKVKIADISNGVASQAWGELRCLYEPTNPPIIDGPCMLLVYWGGTVPTTGYAQIAWLEYPTKYFV